MRFIAIAIFPLALAGCDLNPTLSQAQEAVRHALKDPDSAQFRDVTPCAQAGAVQGEVNSKNSYGGYVGFEPFIYADGEVAIGFGSDNFGKLQRRCYSLDVVANMSNDIDAADDMVVENIQ